jgi:quinol monooxygenase YgiN
VDYGLHVRIEAAPGRGDELEALLLQAAAGLEATPGCLVYVVSRAPEPSDVVYVTELWESRQAHDASLQDPAVREAVAQGRPLIASFASEELRPAGGKLPGT